MDDRRAHASGRSGRPTRGRSVSGRGLPGLPARRMSPPPPRSQIMEKPTLPTKKIANSWRGCASCTGRASRNGRTMPPARSMAQHGAAVLAQHPRARAQPRRQPTFLTHDWGVDALGRNNHARVSLVNDRLKAAGIATWFDEEKMRGDINKQMADGVSASAAVVAFISKRYVEKAFGNGPNGSNDNCKNEFDGALLTPTLCVDKIISVMMEPRCRAPQSWPSRAVQGKLGPKLYIDFASNGRIFDEGMDKLIEEMRVVTSAAPPADSPAPQPTEAASITLRGLAMCPANRRHCRRLAAMIVAVTVVEVMVVVVSVVVSDNN